MVHSWLAIKSIRAGTFGPDMSEAPTTFAGAKALISDAIANLEAIDSTELESHVGNDMAFVFKDMRVPFTAETFLHSFSMPNFYFHISMAYALMRAMGVPIGKHDYLGPLQIKSDA
jgi:uncharacterized protein